MAAITPNTNLKLLKNPNNLSNENQLTFSNATAQYNYFNSLTKLEVEDFTYQRKDYVIRYNACIDDILDYNYCMYQNEAYGNKWFYAYIQNMRWVNDHVTEITIKTDVFQTFQFELTYKASFIEREHVNDDTIGSNTVPEGLETGEYIINEHTMDNTNNDLTCVVGSTLTPGELINIYGGIYNNIPSGITYFRYDNITGENSLKSYLQLLASSAKSDAVTGIFLAPKWLAGGSDFHSVIIPNNTTVGEFNMEITKLSTLNGYNPRNNKLLTYPYVYINMTNGQGANAIYHQELWSVNNNNKMIFKVNGCLTPGCSIRGIPQNYRNTVSPYDEGINLGKFPQLNWTTDQYTNWLTANGVSLGGITLNAEQKGIVGGSLSALLGAGMIAGGNPVGAVEVGNGLGQIVGAMEENYRHSLMPPQAEGNLNSGDVTTATNNNRFHCYKMSIRYEWASRIDKYFDMFGYRVNLVKVPNINGRANWNYVKTIGANIEGLIPEFYLNEIKGLFNAGITLWHNPSTFLDYSQNNNITA